MLSTEESFAGVAFNKDDVDFKVHFSYVKKTKEIFYFLKVHRILLVLLKADDGLEVSIPLSSLMNIPFR